MPSPLAAPSKLVSGLLDRSRAGFRWLKPDNQMFTVGVVVFVTLAATLGIVALGAAFDATIDREVTVDNPDRPPESTCEAFGDDENPVFAEQCDEPERIDVDVGEELQSASGDYVGYALIGVPIWWAIFALALHGGARLAGGAGSLGDSFVIAAWAIAAELARLVAGLAAIWHALATTTVDGTTMESIAREIVAAISAMQGPLLAASAVVIGVQWVVVVGGLEAYHDLDRGVAGVVAGVFALLGFVLAAV
ncbi:YIP1 family protein [Halorubrum halophilum]|uniref:YIP1 family protein n=1 Tax=Halorubrum halophilum TaxID=413816 RepID=UPI000679782D|nr:YIP1 family protein [Halorubrum halophilum]